MRTESNLERKAVQIAFEAGFLARKTQYAGRRGAPDRWFFGKNGQLLIVEFKDPKGALSPAQKKEISMLVRRGHPAWVVDNLGDFRALLHGDSPRVARLRDRNIAMLGAYYTQGDS